MKAAGLKPIATVLETTAILIKSKHPHSNPDLIRIIESRIRGVISMSSSSLSSSYLFLYIMTQV